MFDNKNELEARQEIQMCIRDSSYINSFFNDMEVAVSTARAGNVIGGGDFANDRIVPDCVRAAVKKEDIIVRNPHSTRCV